MPELRHKCEVYRVDMKCPYCDKGYMKPTGVVLSTFPEQYPHVCDVCGYCETYYTTYPFNEYVEINDGCQ